MARIVFLHAFLLDVGESMLGNRGGSYPPHWEVDEGTGSVTIRQPEKVFYSDLPAGEARRAAAALGPQSLASMRQPLTRATWHTVPSTYVVGENDDAAMPPAMREKFASRAGAVHRMPTAHSPFLSHPELTAAMLREKLGRADA